MALFIFFLFEGRENSFLDFFCTLFLDLISEFYVLVGDSSFLAFLSSYGRLNIVPSSSEPSSQIGLRPRLRFVPILDPLFILTTGVAIAPLVSSTSCTLVFLILCVLGSFFLIDFDLPLLLLAFYFNFLLDLIDFIGFLPRVFPLSVLFTSGRVLSVMKTPSVSSSSSSGLLNYAPVTDFLFFYFLLFLSSISLSFLFFISSNFYFFFFACKVFSKSIFIAMFFLAYPG